MKKFFINLVNSCCNFLTNLVEKVANWFEMIVMFIGVMLASIFGIFVLCFFYSFLVLLSIWPVIILLLVIKLLFF